MKTVDKMKKGMGIGGWLTNYKRFNVLPEDKRLDLTIGDLEHFDTYITEADVENIANMGMDHIRLGFDEIVVRDKDGNYREHILDLIEKFILWCEKRDLAVVLHLHKAIGNYCDIPEKVSLLDSPALKDGFVSLWTSLERRFSAYPDVAFELLNEVLDVDPDKWNDLAARAIAALREINRDRTVIVGPTCWNNPDKIDKMRVCDDENVIYTFHMYAPHEFTHQRGVLQWAQLYYNRALEYPCDDVDRYRQFHEVVYNDYGSYKGVKRVDKEVLRACMQPAFDFKKAHPDKVLWCGEFGTIRHADIKSRENWMADVIALLGENDIPYCVWNYLSTPNDGNRFSLVDDDTRKILSPRLLDIINGKV